MCGDGELEAVAADNKEEDAADGGLQNDEDETT